MPDENENPDQAPESVVQDPPGEESFGDMLQGAVDSEEAKLKDGAQLDQAIEGEDPPEQLTDEEKEKKAEEEALFTNLTIGEQKIPFKTEEEFKAFIDSNEMLKSGFSMQSDYTQKTQSHAEAVKEFDERVQKFDQAWGVNHPDENSMGTLNEAWKGYQVATQAQAQIISSILEDAGRIGRGEAPVGYLANVTNTAAGNQTPEMQKIQEQSSMMETKVNRLEMERKADKQQSEDVVKQQAADQAKKEVEEWVVKMDKSGTTVTPEEFKVMSGFSGAINPLTEKPFSYDEMYKLARSHLGKTDVDARKQVIATTKEKKLRNSTPPTSNASANADAEDDSIFGILDSAKKQLQGT